MEPAARGVGRTGRGCGRGIGVVAGVTVGDRGIGRERDCACGVGVELTGNRVPAPRGVGRIRRGCPCEVEADALGVTQTGNEATGERFSTSVQPENDVRVSFLILSGHRALAPGQQMRTQIFGKSRS